MKDIVIPAMGIIVPILGAIGLVLGMRLLYDFGKQLVIAYYIEKAIKVYVADKKKAQANSEWLWVDEAIDGFNQSLKDW